MRDINTNLLRLSAGKVEGEVGGAYAVRDNIVVGSTAYDRGPLTLEVHLYLKRSAHKGSGGGGGVEVVYLELTEHVAALEINYTVEGLGRVARLGREAAGMQVHILVGKLGIIVVYCSAVVRSAMGSGRAVCRSKGLALEDISLHIIGGK